MECTGERAIEGQSSTRTMADHLERYRFAQQFVEGKDVLDIACGSGYGTALLAEGGARSVVGMDLSSAAIAHAEKNHASRQISFRQGDLQTLHLPTTFDVIVSFETIEHVQEYMQALHALFEALRPHGTLIFSTPNRRITSPHLRSIHGKPNNPFHVREFLPEEMSTFLQQVGFLPEHIHLYGQRQQKRILPTRLLRFIYKCLVNPAVHASPKVLPVESLHPRYMVIVANKE
ncbi:MAG: class I SAM-dependent methyltransferase [Candidatus Peregrinibacteria bacterium]